MDGRDCLSRSILARRKRGLWQQRPRGCLNWRRDGTPRRLNIGPSGVKSVSSPIELLLTPSGRGKDCFAEEFQARRYQLFRSRTKQKLTVGGSKSCGYSAGIQLTLHLSALFAFCSWV